MDLHINLSFILSAWSLSSVAWQMYCWCWITISHTRYPSSLQSSSHILCSVWHSYCIAPPPHAVRENAVVRWPHGSIRFQSYICQPLSMFSRCWDCYLFSFLSVKFRVIKIGWVIEDVWREVISVYFCSWINLLSSTCRDLLLSNWAFVILISRLFWKFPKKLSPYWKHHSKSDSD